MPWRGRRARHMEIEYHAPDERAVELWIEPWGDRIEVAPATGVRVTFEGKIIESLVISWLDNGLWLGLPRYAVLRVFAESGEQLREYDTRSVPPAPPGLRPI